MTRLQEKDKDYDYIFKIVLVGDTSVGKSCILVRFSDDVFSDNYITTIGVDFRFKTMVVDNKVAKIQIWDTAGQERYRSITTTYYRGASAIIICCDVTCHDSFNNLNNWIDEITKYTDADISKLVLVNKCDLANEERQIEKKEIEEFENKNNIKVMEVSAKTGEGIDGAFRYLVEKLISQKNKGKSDTLTINSDGKNNNKGCC